MTIAETLAAKVPPVSMDKDGVLRVAGTRVTLDLLVEECGMGATADEIALAYDSLSLADVYGALDYYLRNRSVVEEYLRHREAESVRIRSEVERRSPQEGIRELLLSRKPNRG